MEKIQSIGIGRDCITMMFGDGENEELKRCPFSVCGLYHSTDLAVCPTTGKPIAEELKRLAEEVRCREESARKQQLAGRAEEEYEKAHLSGWKNKWREVVFIFGTAGSFFLVYNVLVASGLNEGLSMLCGIVIAFVWAWFWAKRVKKYVEGIRARAEEIHQFILAGGRLDSQTIGSYLKKS